jgi:hypothetical protein
LRVVPRILILIGRNSYHLGFLGLSLRTECLTGVRFSIVPPPTLTLRVRKDDLTVVQSFIVSPPVIRRKYLIFR